MDPGFTIYYESDEDEVNEDMKAMVEAIGLPNVVALEASDTEGSMAVALTKAGDPVRPHRDRWQRTRTRLGLRLLLRGSHQDV
jgi:hypothetical protein